MADEEGERPADHPDDEGDEGEDETGTWRLVPQPFNQDVEDKEEDEGET